MAMLARIDVMGQKLSTKSLLMCATNRYNNYKCGCDDLKPLPYNEDFGTSKLVYSSSIASDVVAHRRELHKFPELKYEEYKTSEYVYKALKSLGIAESNIMKDIAVTGVIAHIGKGTLQETLAKHAFDTDEYMECCTMKNATTYGPDYNPTIVLRADMDALPIHELADVPFKSLNDGVMHACGHDGHTAMLLGAAAILKQKEEELIELGGSVRLFFQPAEEGGPGAYRMMQEGALNGGDAAVMLHTAPWFRVGTFHAKEGAIMATGSLIRIIVHGVGGHAAAPHLAKDPITAAAAIILGAQTIVSRIVPPSDSVVLSFTFVRAGTTTNVIPEEVELVGTIRALSEEMTDLVTSTLELRANEIAKAYGCTASVFDSQKTRANSSGMNFKGKFPPLMNDKEIFNLGMETAAKMFGEDDASVMNSAEMTGEDFAIVAATIPSAMFWIGHRNIDHPLDYRTGNNLHNARLELDERMLPRGAAFMSTLAMEYIKSFLRSEE